MFLEYFRLREQPFGVTPDPRYLFATPGHREALASLVYGIESNLGFGALLAEPGMGKTTLLYHVLERYRQTARTAFIFNTQCNSYDLLQSFLTELDEKQVPRDTFQLHERLKQILAREAQARRRVLLVIDEAQNLGDMVMETVRLLSNFESPDSKLVHIILAGQPELAAKLAGSNLSQLLQRIPIITNLKRLTPEEVASYIEHRLRVAGSPARPLFRPGTIEHIARLSRGVPREINRLCFNCLSLACASSKPAVDLQVIEEVETDLDLSAHLQKPDAATPQRSASVHSMPARVDVPLPGAGSAVLPERRAAESIRPVALPAPQPRVPALPPNNRTATVQSNRASSPAQQRNLPRRAPVARSYRWPTLARPFAFGLLYLTLIVAGGMGVTRWLYPASSIATAQPAGESEDVLARDPDNVSAPVHVLAPANSRTRDQGRTQGETYRQRRQGKPPAAHPMKTDAFDDQSPASDVTLRNTTRPAQNDVEVTVANTTRRLQPSIRTNAQEELLSFVPVQYPETALDRRIEGTVVLNAMVARDGTVRSIRPVSGDPLLMKAATNAVRGWIYRPYRVNGTPVVIDKEVVISFSLSSGSNP